MSSASRSTGAVDFLRAERLKNELIEFATTGDLKREYELQRKLFLAAGHPEDEHEAESVLDWFLFDWYNENGDGVIANYMDAELALDDADREILLDWLDSINSVFETRSVGKNSLQLCDLDSDDVYTVKTRDRTPFKRGQFVIARLLPVGDDLILSGLQFVMPDRESALAWLEMRRAFDSFDSPEAVEKARREQCSAFCELFGCDELTVASSKLNPTLQRFQRYLLTERRDPETGLTPAERFRKDVGQELRVPDLPPLPEPIAGAGEVTILCDDFDGIVLLPDFSRFKLIFESDRPGKHVADWKQLVWIYIKNPEIPIVAFERVAEQHPRRVEKVLRSVLGDKGFSLEHMYAALLHYKQPVDGLEDLKDDEQLWDLFNGNTYPKSSKSGTVKTKSRGKMTGAAKKPRARATAKQSAKKASAGRAHAATSRIKRKPVAKLPTKRKSKPAPKRTAPSTRSRTRKTASTRKR